MQLQPAAFNRFLGGIGQRAEWRSSMSCPCISPHSGAPDPACPHCSGRGVIWREPEQVVIGSSGRDAVRTWAQYGQFDAGDMVAIIGSDSPAYEIATNDRVTMLDRTESFSVNLIAGVQDRILFPVDRIDMVVSADGGVLRRLAEPGVLGDGSLDWRGDGPAPGASISVSGRRRCDFFVFNDAVFDRPHHGGARLPRRVVLRRIDLFQRAGGT